MTDNVGHYNFPEHTKGDTFDGVLFTINVNTISLDLSGPTTTIVMDLKLSPNDIVPVKRFDNGTNGGITIYNPSDGQFSFNPQVIDVNAGYYFYDIKITLSNGVIKTYINGHWTIL